MKRTIVLIAVVLLCSQSTQAWVYPEHRDIAVLGVMKLDTARKYLLDSLWSLARTGHENRLPASIIIGHLPPRPNYIDWAAWTAIGGDHSCSPQSMIETILESDWILDVARVTETYKRELAVAATPSDRANATRDSDINLQRADPNYATRAGANNAHFLLPRDSYHTTANEFVTASLVQGDEINALGVYYWFHYRALAKAARLSKPGLSDEERQRLALAALADEAYGLHFLEDTFASGHVAGTWGSASLRKGTHDYYNHQGLETTTWGGDKIVLLGDAYMRPEDAELPAEAVRHSLAQIIDAFDGKEPYASHYFNPDRFSGVEMMEPDTLNSCTNTDMPGRVASIEIKGVLLETLNMVPVPALKSGYGSLPRFRTELGVFMGVSPYMRGSGTSGGFGESQNTSGATGSLGMNLRFGLGLEGVTSESGDGLVFLDVGILHDNASTTKFSNDPDIDVLGDIVSAVPSRAAIATRIRMPFWLIPGDLLVGALFIAPFSIDTYTQMAVIAANGGLIPWQAGLNTPIGRFQFILGREVGVNFYGYTAQDNILVPIDDSPNGNNATLVSMRSIQIEAPILELRPFRTFSVDQSSSMVLQFFVAADIPTVWEDIIIPGYEHNLQTIISIGFRGAFDWRYYF